MTMTIFRRILAWLHRRRWNRRIDTVAYGDAKPVEVTQVLAHVAVCGPCERELRSVRAIRRAIERAYPGGSLQSVKGGRA